MDIKYCEITFKGKGLGLSGNMRAMVDYGQDRNLLTKNYIKDENGEDIIFKGTIDAFNFMYKNGWEIDKVYELTWSRIDGIIDLSPCVSCVSVNA